MAEPSLGKKFFRFCSIDHCASTPWKKKDINRKEEKINLQRKYVDTFDKWTYLTSSREQMKTFISKYQATYSSWMPVEIARYFYILN